MIRWLLAAAGLVGVPVRAQAPQVAVALVPEVVTLQPGLTFRMGVQLGIPQGWHLYWTNPGQSGLPTTLEWRLPAAVEHRATAWPVPGREDSAGIVTHTYRDEVALVSELRVAPNAVVGTVDLVASLGWGVCREICIPQRRDVRMSLPVGTLPAQASPRWGAFYAAAAARLPGAAAHVTFHVGECRGGLELTIRRSDQSPLAAANATFFPDQPGALAVLVKARPMPGGVTYALTADSSAAARTPRLRGVLVPDVGQALLVDVAVEHRAPNHRTPACAVTRSRGQL